VVVGVAAAASDAPKAAVSKTPRPHGLSVVQG
jgi:hypothetical protein